MALNIALDYPGYPPGTQLGVVGVGVFENGGDAVDLTEAEESVFYATNGYTLDSEMAATEGMTVSGSPDFTPPPPPEDEVESEQPSNAPSRPQNQQSGLPPDNPPEEEGGS